MSATDRDLGAVDHRVLNAICWKVVRQGDEWKADPSHQLIARRAAVDVRNLTPPLTKLQRRGYVTLVRTGRKNDFTIHYTTDDPDTKIRAAQFMSGHEKGAKISPAQFMREHEKGDEPELMPGDELPPLRSPEFMPGNDRDSCPDMSELMPGHELHIESEEEDSTKKGKTKTPSLPLGDVDAFEELWAIWPRKVAKGNARKAYRSALKRTTAAEILNGVRRFDDETRRKGTETRFIPHLASWLNADRWTDEPEVSSTQRSGAMSTAVDSAMRAAERAEGLA